MGLDMYLHARRFDHSGNRWEPEEDKRPEHNGWKQSCTEYDVGYWRKFAPLHHYIINHFADEDDCSPIYLDQQQCRQIADALRNPYDSFELDECGGFFFGSKEQWEDDLKHEAVPAADLFDKVADWLDEGEPDCWRSCYYQASW